MSQKKCNCCKISKEIYEFYKDKNYTDGRRRECKECRRSIDKNRYNNNRKKKLEQAKVYYSNNSDKIKNYQKIYNKENKDKLITKRKKYYIDNKERISSRRKIYYMENRERLIEDCKNWKKKNIDRVRELNKLSRDRNKEKQKEKKHKRRTLLGSENLKGSIFSLEKYNKYYFNSLEYTCEYCGNSIAGTYDLDHILPICKGGTNNIENLAISCSSCNRGENGKHSKLLEEFKPSLIPYFNTRKLKNSD